MAPEITVRIDFGTVAAGLIFRQGVVIDAAPVLRYLIGKSMAQVVKIAKRKHWIIHFVYPHLVPAMIDIDEGNDADVDVKLINELKYHALIFYRDGHYHLYPISKLMIAEV